MDDSSVAGVDDVAGAEELVDRGAVISETSSELSSVSSSAGSWGVSTSNGCRGTSRYVASTKSMSADIACFRQVFSRISSSLVAVARPMKSRSSCTMAV